MRRRMTLIVAGVAALVAFALGGAAIANATQGSEGDDGSQPVSGAAAERAEAAALAQAGGGSVTELARDPEGARIYEVEVKKPDGSIVDIDLDRSFKVLAAENDSDEANESAEDDQDGSEPDDQDDNDRNEQADSDD
jgi:hypothetical protein